MLNLVRIVLLLGLGSRLGQQVALEVVHPVAGLLLLNVAFAVLLLAAPRFGLRLGSAPDAPDDTPLTAPATTTSRMRRGHLVRRLAAVTVGPWRLPPSAPSVPATAAVYDGGVPAATAFSAAPEMGPGFVGTGAGEAWSRVYFGRESTWSRYTPHPASASVGYSVWVDSVLTPDWAALRAHPLLDCYPFHGFELVARVRPTLTPASSSTRSSIAAPTARPGTSSAGSGPSARRAATWGTNGSSCSPPPPRRTSPSGVTACPYPRGARGVLAQRAGGVPANGSGPQPRPTRGSGRACGLITGDRTIATRLWSTPMTSLALDVLAQGCAGCWSATPCSCCPIWRSRSGAQRWPRARRTRQDEALARSAGRTDWPAVDVVVPVYNEPPDGLDRCCASLVAQDYPGRVHVLLVDDGSRTAKTSARSWSGPGPRPAGRSPALDSNVGKRAAQYAAIGSGRADLVLTVDSDTQVAPDAMRRLVERFDAPQVGAATVSVRVSNAGTNLLTRLVDLRYWVAFHQERASHSLFGAVLCCSGPLSMYRRRVLRAVWPHYAGADLPGVPCTYGDDRHLTNLVLGAG